MLRGKTGVFAGVAAVALIFGSAPVSADHHEIGAVDDTPPAAVTGVIASANVSTSIATVTWMLSASDVAGGKYTSVGNYANNSGANVVHGSDVTEYIIQAGINGADPVEVGRVPAGTGSYPDQAVAGDTRSYVVIATDGTNLSDPAASLPVTFGAPPDLVFLRESGTFDLAPVSQSGPLDTANIVMSVRNEGLGDGFVTLIYDNLPSGFSILHSGPDVPVPSNTTFLVGPEGFLGFDVRFDANEVENINRIHEVTFAFLTNQGQRIDHVVTVTLIGGAEAELSVVTQSLIFNKVLVNVTRSRNLTISNIGELPLVAIARLRDSEPVFSLSTLNVTGGGSDSVTLNITAGGSEVVVVSFTPTIEGALSEDAIIIESADDPSNPQFTVALTGQEGTVAADNEVSAAVVEVTLTFASTVSAAALIDGSPANEALKLSFRDVFAAQLGIPASRIVINLIVAGSTEVTFQILDPPEDDTEAPSAAAAAAALETIVADEPATLVAALEAETGEELGTVDAITSEAVVVVIQPIDEEGDAVAGWFTRTGTKVDFDDFFAFADAFGSSLGDASFDSVFDISGSELVSDGQVNFDDFFKFADDFGKTVANAADVQELLGLAL